MTAMLVLYISHFPARAAYTYTISGSNFLKNNIPITLRGTNAMHVFEGDSSDMSDWNINIVREFIGNMRDNPIAGYAVYVNGSYLHPLQDIVNNNRANGKVTILCPFGWDGTPQTAFVGTNPSQTPWWKDYMSRYRMIANQFKNQPDVWFEVWNEPYWWDRSHGYSDALWLSDMEAMVDNIRSTRATNIILVPGAETGQDEDVILTTGKSLLSKRHNIGFDVHAYEKWLNDSQLSVQARIEAVENRGFAMLFGELGPHNSSNLMNPANFLAAADNENSTVISWLWKYDGTDPDALLNTDGTPNNNNNYHWGSTYQAFTKCNSNQRGENGRSNNRQNYLCRDDGKDSQADTRSKG